MTCSTSIRLLVVLTACFLAPASPLRLEASPNQIDLMVNKSLEISCILDGPSASSQDVVVIQIRRPNQSPIANIDTKHGLTFGVAATSKIQANGHVDNKAGRSYLTLTIKDPEISDSGVYQCSLFYMDQTYKLREEKAEINITIYNEDLTSVVSLLFKKVSSLERKTAKLEQDITKRISVDQNQMSELEILRTQLTNLNTTHQNQEGSLPASKETLCGFHVSYTENTLLQRNQIVLFKDEITNIGNAYNTTTGVFKAPKHGLYVFHLVMKTVRNGDQITVHIYVNKDKGDERWVASLFTEGENSMDQSSVSSVVELQAGDDVTPVVYKVVSTNKAWNNNYSLFSGFLLKVIS